MVEVEYRIASGDSTFDSNALFVPRWSKSWQRQATSKPKICKKTSCCKEVLFLALVMGVGRKTFERRLNYVTDSI